MRSALSLLQSTPQASLAPDLRPLRVAFDRALAYRALQSRPPRPDTSALEMQTLFGGALPERGADGATLIDQLATSAERGLMATTGRNFFGWVIGASNPVGVAADWLASAWGQNAAFFAASPAACMVEKIAGEWIVDALDLPRESSVGFVTGATMANFTCLAAARHAQFSAHGWDVEADGVYGAPPLHVFIGEEAHATVFSALRYLALESALAFVEGPKIVIAQAGQINTGAFDPLAQIAAAAHAHDAWVHIDGAFGLWARACPQTRALANGADAADSWATDGHKWLQLPYDCGIAIVRDAHAHRAAMSIEASYLPNADALEHNPAQYGPELSRRARGFAAWAVLRALGREGIAEMIGRHCRLAQRLASKLQRIPGVEILNTVELNQLAIAFGADALTRATIRELQEENICFAAGGKWKGREIMRVSIIAEPLQEEDIDRLAAAIAAAFTRTKARTDCQTNTRDIAP
jgi:glutamate/tyrosine decarboxylase-like PLP-dependent enzyme